MRMSRQWCLVFLVLCAAWLGSSRAASLGAEGRYPPPDGDSIQLPSGSVVKIASFEAHPKWKECFPPDHPFFAEKYPEGKLQGMHSRHVGRLDGASVILHENGNLKTLAFYPGGDRQGPCRVWDEDTKMLLYARYKDDKKHGVTCLFKDGAPWLVQEWNMGSLEGEGVVARKGNDYAPVDDAQQLAQARGTLSAVEKESAEDERELDDSVRSWFVEAQKRTKEGKEKALLPVVQAQSRAAKQAIRERKDALVAAAHTHGYVRDRDSRGRDRVARVAAADSMFAARDLDIAKKNAAAITNEGKQKLQQIDRSLAQEYRELYEFALAALEAAMPDEPSGPKAHMPGKEPDRQKTFVVTYIGGNPPRRHTDRIRASSVEEAKQDVRNRYPRATFKKIEEK